MQQDMLDCATGQFALVRPGANPRQSLRAWDAADEYLISLIHDTHKNTPVTIINDHFGSLGAALNQQAKSWITDSYCAASALVINQKKNDQSNNIKVTPSLEKWPIGTSLAVMKLPKNLSYLHYLLEKCLQANISTVLIAGMMKHLPKNILTLLQHFGSVERLPFKKKATVYKLTLENVEACPYPKTNTFLGTELISHANVFGRDKLDPGAEFLIQHMSNLPKVKSVADLCCGSGILGIQYAKTHFSDTHDTCVDFFDESNMAVHSAERSWLKNNMTGNAHFNWEDGIAHKHSGYDLILCNPPFHEEHTVGDHIARRLFSDARQHLNKNGKLIVVGNRHLGYHVTLKKYFANVSQISSNGKFVLLSAHA
jgi:16S rRNA G1207 methylase RsmC